MAGRPINVLITYADSDLAISLVTSLSKDRRCGSVAVGIPGPPNDLPGWLLDGLTPEKEFLYDGAGQEASAALARFDAVCILPSAEADDESGDESLTFLKNVVANGNAGNVLLVDWYQSDSGARRGSVREHSELRAHLEKCPAKSCAALAATVLGNLLLSIMLFQAIPKRLLMLPLDEARFSPITLFDLAEAAKNILLSCTPDTEGAMSFAPEHRGRGYHVTGPEAVDGVELAELLSRFTRGDATEDGGFAGYEVQYVSCSRNEAKRVLVDLCELHAMGGTLGISSEGDRADGLASWTVRSKEVEAFLNLFDHLKSSHERAEEELRTGARIPDDPLHQVETCVTEDLKYLIGREGLGISDLLDKQQLSIVNEVQLSNALSPRSSLSRRQRSESKETLSETSMESSSP